MPKLILIHGNSSSPASFSKTFVQKHSAQNICLPGHAGRESDDPDRDYSVKGMIKYLLHEIQDECPFLLVGNSLGGHLAIEVAHQLENCQGLVFFGAPPLSKPLNFDQAFLPNTALNLFLKGEYTEEELISTLAEISSGEKVRHELAAFFKKTDKRFRDVFARSVLEHGELADEVEIIKTLGKPVFIIHGKEDPSANLKYMRSLDGVTKIYELENCGHYPSMEQPELFDEIITEIKAQFD